MKKYKSLDLNAIRACAVCTTKLYVILFQKLKVQRQPKESGKIVFARVYMHFLN